MMLKLFAIFSERLRRIFGEREIQAMVVLSLSFQTILIVMGYSRKVSTSNNLIVLLWSSYLLASWFATVSLSIISNNLGNAENKPIDTKLVITSFWAPFFLLHLAGPDTITAYSLEDNALWRRHALTLASQVGVTVFVIIRAWENTVLNILTVAMMIPGIIKIGERIWVLRSASSENFKATTLRRPDPGPNYARYMEEYRSKKEEGFDVTSGTFIEAPIVSDISIPKPANAKIADAHSLQCAYILFKTFKQLFSDLILSIQDIKNSQSFFQKVQFEEAFKVIEVELGFMYDVFYTKAYKVYSLVGGILRLISFSSTVIVLLVFAIVVDDKSVYSREERMVTYILLSGAIFLEIYSVLILITSDWSMLWLSKRKTAMVDLWYNSISSVPLLVPKKRWSNTMGQYNLITYCLHRKKPTCRAIQRFLFHYELLEKQRYENSMDVSVDLKKLIFEHLLEKSKIALELKVCKELCACRGERVLKIAKCRDCINKEKNKKQNEDVEVESEEVPKDAKCFYELSKENRKTLQDSVEGEFDQSILLWHIATTLCYYSDRNTNSNNPVNCPNYEASKSLSDYMLYLLVMRPILLPNGIEQIRFQDTCAEADEFFYERKSILDETQACIKLLEVSTEIPPSIVKGDRSKSVLFDGCRLAKSLQCMEYQKKWELVSHVWVEMLCYAATKCRWNHHAQQLIRGGELFTHFWLLMSHLGITEQFQISKGHARAMLVVH
ncbi:hypothetical protein ACB092_05G023000 [Castanea dentata]